MGTCNRDRRGRVEVVPDSIRGAFMTRLLAGAGASAVLVLSGAAACGGPSASVAAHPAGSAHSSGHSRVSADAGTVMGRFVIFGTMGRPGRAVDHPAPATVVFTDGRHRVLIARAGRSGTFFARLPPGTYHVYGHSPRLITVSQNGSQREDRITLAHPISVTAGRATKIVLRAIVP
jgi:hypothetical protein